MERLTVRRAGLTHPVRPGRPADRKHSNKVKHGLSRVNYGFRSLEVSMAFGGP